MFSPSKTKVSVTPLHSHFFLKTGNDDMTFVVLILNYPINGQDYLGNSQSQRCTQSDDMSAAHPVALIIFPTQ